MKKINLSINLVVMGLLLSACGQTTPSVKDNTSACATIEKNLLKVDLFTQKIESMSAFHVEEYARAIKMTEISRSNNKPQMLKDAVKRKQNLLEEQKDLGCTLTD